MTLQKGVVSGLSGISSGVSFRLSQSNWYRKPLKQLQKMNEAASSLTAPISDNLPSAENSCKALEGADACSLGRISCFTPNFPLCTGNMETFRFQIWAECKELLQTSLAFTGSCTSVMSSRLCWDHHTRQLCWSECSYSRRGWPVVCGSGWVSLEKFAINMGTEKWCPHREKHCLQLGRLNRRKHLGLILSEHVRSKGVVSRFFYAF